MKKSTGNLLGVILIGVIAIVSTTMASYFANDSFRKQKYIEYLQNNYDKLDKEYQDYIDSTYNIVYSDSIE